MRFLSLLILLLLCGASCLRAQAEVLDPIAVTDLESDGKSIFVNTATGIPVLQTMSAYIGLSPKDGSIMWEVKRNSGAALTESLDSDSGNKDFDEIPNTPLVMASGTLLNVLNGKVLIDGTKNDLRRLRTYYVLPDQDMMLLEIAGKGAIYLYAVNPFENTQLWGVQLRELSGLSQAVSEGNENEDLNPMLNAVGDLIYDNGKYLALIDMKSGELKWNEKLNAGYIYTSKDGARMVVAEKRGGLGGMMSAAPLDGAAAKGVKFGKKLHLLDTETGESVWKKEKKMDGNVLYVTPFEEGFLVVHDEGMNIYSFTDPKGDGRWKKDYKEKGVVNVEKGAEGLMVYFKNKRMLVDPVSGDEKWKKPEKLEKEPGGFLWGLMNYEPLSEQVGVHTVTFYGSYLVVGEGFSSRRFPYNQILVEADRIVTAIPEPTEGTRIGKPRYIIEAIELSEEKVTSKRKVIGVKKGLAAIDKVENGYFLYNDRGFILMDYSPETGWEETMREYYPDPTAALRTLTGIATAAGAMAYTTTQTSNMLTSSASGNAGAAQAYNNRMNAMTTAGDAGFGFATDRKINGRVDNDFAFFFARDGKEGATLFKVDKNTGQEVSKYRFDDLTPLYEIDYVNGRLYYQAKKKFSIFMLK